MEKLIAWFVHRPLLVNLIMALVFMMGYITIADMRYEYNPHIDMGVIDITTVRAGAGPEEVELSITLPLEEELLQVEGIRKLYSNSMENLSVITLTLDLDAADKQDILRNIQRAVDRATVRLPPDLLEKPLVYEQSTLTTPIMDVHVTGDVPESLLREVARNTADSLREVEGIASVTRIGYRRPEVKIMLAPEKLSRLGISHEEIIRAIRARNIRDSGGAIDSFTTEKKVVAVGQFRQPKDVEEVIIRATEPGNTVRVRDVAQVVLDYEDWEMQSRVDGQMSIILRARKKALADETHTAAAVREFAGAAQLPDGVELKMVGDISRLTDNMLEVLVGNAVVGLTAVFLLLCYFLELRFALWVSVGIPFSICLSFLLLSAMGHTINSMSLAGIILMMGILVDDAVVVSENTQRLRSKGLPLEQASILGAGQVSPPVIFSALTTVLAFLPLGVLSGPAGEWMVPFIAAVVSVLFASLFESHFMLPGHLAHVPGQRSEPERKAFERLRNSYHRGIERILRRRYISLAVFSFLFIAVMAIGAMTIKFTLFPDIDIDTVHIKVELPSGSSFEQTVAAVDQLEDGVRKLVDPRDLLAITAEIGHHDTNFYGATEGRNNSWAVIAVQLHPLGWRDGDTNTQQLTRDIEQWAQDIAGFKSLVVQAQTDLPVSGEPVEVEVISNGEERFAVAEAIKSFIQSHPGATSVWTSRNRGKDIIDLEFNHALLASRGLTVKEVIRSARVAVDGLLVDELQTLDERIRYRLQLPLAQAGKLKTLENLSIINDRGEAIYLDSVAGFKFRPGQANLKHYFGKRTVTVFAEIDDTVTTVSEINRSLQQFIVEQNWPKTYPHLRIVVGGEMEEVNRMQADLGAAALIALIAIFAALVILFNSLSQPILVLSCLPYGMIGVVLCYSVQGMAMGSMAVMGIIGLMGVLVNDSLVLLHTMNRAQSKKGRPLNTLDVADVCRKRFRPIFITSITTAVAMMPTAYGIMGENSYLKPIFMSMAWGVLFGCLVTLLLLPVLYMIDQDVHALYRRWRPAGADSNS